MPGQAQDLPNENAGTGESLDFTTEQLLKELAAYFEIDNLQPGDITVDIFRKYFGCGVDTAYKRLAELVQKGVLKKIKVRAPGHKWPIIAYRKVKE